MATVGLWGFSFIFISSFIKRNLFKKIFSSWMKRSYWLASGRLGYIFEIIFFDYYYYYYHSSRSNAALLLCCSLLLYY